jgi:fatty acyl-CoA reductase
MKNRENVKVVIWRPSIITSSYNQPFPGWTDSVSAAGGLTVLTGLGLVHNINGTGLAPFDIVPADFVSNGILVVTAYADTQPDFADVFNCASSVCNQINLIRYRDIGVATFQNLKLNDAMGKASIRFNHNEYEF